MVKMAAACGLATEGTELKMSVFDLMADDITPNKQNTKPFEIERDELMETNQRHETGRPSN